MKTRLFPLGLILFFAVTIISSTSDESPTEHSVTERLLRSKYKTVLVNENLQEKAGETAKY